MTTDSYYLNKKKTIGLLLACLMLIILFFFLGWVLGSVSERAKMEAEQMAAEGSESSEEKPAGEEGAAESGGETSQENTTSMAPSPGYALTVSFGSPPASILWVTHDRSRAFV